MKLFFWSVTIAAVTAASAGGWWYITVGNEVPRNDRQWVAKLERTPQVRETPDGAVIIRHVRNWTYGHGEVLSRQWIDKVVVQPEQITRLWFLLEPFPEWDATGHTYLTFDFADGTTLSFSVEGRREVDEEFSALHGMLRGYELTYSWGTERDFLARRLLYLGNEVRMYPLAVEPEIAESIFRALARETQALAETPRFYNTITSNCTNLLAQAVNERFPGTLPPHISWVLSGWSDKYLMRHGWIPITGSIAATKERYRLAPLRELINERATDDPDAFSERVRALLGYEQ